MDKIQIDIVEPEFVETFVKSLLLTVSAAVRIPEFRRHKEFFAVDPAFADGISDIDLVFIDRGGIDMTVSVFESPQNGIFRNIARRRAPAAYSEPRDLRARVEGYLRVNIHKNTSVVFCFIS